MSMNICFVVTLQRNRCDYGSKKSWKFNSKKKKINKKILSKAEAVEYIVKNMDYKYWSKTCLDDSVAVWLWVGLSFLFKP